MHSDSAVKALAALAQQSRLAIFRLLVQAGLEGIHAGRIGETLGLAPATLSFHLKELANAGLIASRQEGRHVIYQAQYERMNELLGFLMEHCCEGDPKGCGAPSFECQPKEPARYGAPRDQK
ncbi:metalloregulator ArsR/SmtB family transcription factor [Cupriavidus basilensis]|uniref:Metalloregulator ArsR/SmtB family transcription factor n=1 Tax=Cupriavidus basilensis TaxID=68895 RepID=A0ABT6ATT2_9BURK|nr:helix-turn-helix transcriptional regulator [Cupriavidus basilensis]MDF3836005.1 metalloregulator ArsR/SmtB family transcription factor [Cupriavidus basilensis]